MEITVLFYESAKIGLGLLLFVFAVMNAINISKLKDLLEHYTGITKENKVKPKNSLNNLFSRIRLPKIRIEKQETQEVRTVIQETAPLQTQPPEPKVYVKPHIPIQPKPVQAAPKVKLPTISRQVNEENEEEYNNHITNLRKQEELIKEYEAKLSLLK